MHFGSLLLSTVVLIIALNNVPTSAKTVKPAATTTTTTTTPATTTKALATAKPAAVKPAGPGKVQKKKKPAKKSKKPKQSPWKTPEAEQKKLFNDYKTILRTKLNARNLNISATYPLEATKYGSLVHDKSVLHHFLIKLPDSKYAHAIIGTNTDGKKPAAINENSASIRRTIYDNLAAAQA